ncbi:MAG: hypothetical protein KC592_17565 [Nitrospira sp.]|nr:hypothetical protein [Nitrospira sp.]
MVARIASKELKIGFGMERLPCGTFAANAVFFRIGVLAYNLFVLFKMLALPHGLEAVPSLNRGLTAVSDSGESGPAYQRGDSQSTVMSVAPV